MAWVPALFTIFFNAVFPAVESFEAPAGNVGALFTFAAVADLCTVGSAAGVALSVGITAILGIDAGVGVGVGVGVTLGVGVGLALGVGVGVGLTLGVGFEAPGIARQTANRVTFEITPGL